MRVGIPVLLLRSFKVGLDADYAVGRHSPQVGGYEAVAYDGGVFGSGAVSRKDPGAELSEPVNAHSVFFVFHIINPPVYSEYRLCGEEPDGW